MISRNLEPQTYSGLGGSCHLECLLDGSFGVARSKGPVRRVVHRRPGYSKRRDRGFGRYGVFGKHYRNRREEQLPL